MAAEEFQVNANLAALLIAKDAPKANYCSKKFTYLNIVGFGGAATILTFHWFTGTRLDGTPPTFLGFGASERLIWACPIAAALELVGFFALNSEITSVLFALVYLFAVTRGMYDAAFIVSRAWNIEDDDFNDIVNFAHFYYYNISRRKLPQMVDIYQKREKCCGWGKFHWNKWAKELNTTDLPDSCCRAYYVGCGKGILPRRPSGFLFLLNATDASGLRNLQRDLETKFNTGRWNVKLTEINRYWRSLYPEKEKDNFEIWNPMNPVSSWYLRLIDEEFAEDYENLKGSAAHRTISVIIGTDIANNRSLVYTTKGLEEQFRIQSIVHPKPCETTRGKRTEYKLPDKQRGVIKTEDINIIGDLRKIMQPVRLFGLGLGGIYILMFLIFFHYFQAIKANELAHDSIPVDFQDTGVTTTAFMSRPKQFIAKKDFEKMVEEQKKKREVISTAAEALAIRYNMLIGMHQKGIILKKNKLKQPKAPKDVTDRAAIDKYQMALLSRLPPKFYPTMVDRFTQAPLPFVRPTPSNQRTLYAGLPQPSSATHTLATPNSSLHSGHRSSHAAHPSSRRARSHATTLPGSRGARSHATTLRRPMTAPGLAPRPPPPSNASKR